MKSYFIFLTALLINRTAVGQTLVGQTVDAVPGNSYTYNDVQMPHYGIKWFTDLIGEPSLNMPSAFFNATTLKFFTGGSKKLSIGYYGDMEALGPFLINSGSASTQFIHFKNGGTDFAKIGSASGIYGGSAADLGLYVNGNNKLELVINNVKRLVVSGDGMIGIGTESPAAKVNINIPANEALHSAMKFGVPNDAGLVAVPLGASTGGYNIDFATWRDVAPNQVGARIRAERINIYQNNNALVQGMDICFSTSTAGSQTQLTERLRIKYNGQAGIGTTTVPTDYKLAVAGKVIAEEIKVKLQSSGWSDYVFDSSYNLMPLDEVKKFINENGRLPEVPSAKEVEKEGLSLGCNQALLLKKIEELTLHLINIEKKMSEQEEKLIKQGEQISRQ